ncbi:MAG TPA: hypothetical protein VI112_07595 [Bacteroidia bacterium]|jgi:hypothetical protein
MFRKINIKEELLKEKALPTRQTELIHEVYGLLRAKGDEDEEILARLRTGKQKEAAIEPISIPAEHPNIFTLGQIKKVCVEYRLRFLDTKQFKGEYPYEALLKIKQFESKYGARTQQFMVMAPSRMFRLLDPDKDPLLFANIGNGNYYLVHQWGNDLAWYRKILSWPMQNMRNLLISILGLTLFVAAGIPSSLLHSIFYFTDAYGKIHYQPTYLVRFVIFFLGTLGTLSFFIKYALRSNKNLSDADWDNKFLG